MMELAQAATVMGGVHSGENRMFNGVTSDSRRLRRADLFFAIRGEHTDGHRFIAEASAAGAAGAVVDRAVAGDLPTIQVADTTRALGALGQEWRQRFALPVVAITGSNGKTTVTALVASILAQVGDCLQPEKSFNNQWGVPLTLLRLRQPHRFAVIEMGTNHAGEIDYLSRLTAPTVALINNIGQAHLEGLGDVAQVAQAKAEILHGLVDGGIAVLNRDDAFYPEFTRIIGDLKQEVRLLGFGIDNPGPVKAERIHVGIAECRFELTDGSTVSPVILPLPGRHNVMNALAAATVCYGLGVAIKTIARGLARATAVGGRLVRLNGVNGCSVIDDSYNANPVSVEAGIAVLAGYSGRRMLVLGGMAELGADAAPLHRQIGQVACAAGIDDLFVLAPEAQPWAREYAVGYGQKARVFTTMDALNAALAAEISPATAATTTILVKGSRSSRMDKVVAALTAAEPEARPC